MSPSLHRAAKWIIKNTLVSNESLTPELRLRLITIASPLWMSAPDSCPLPDPYWAFYWPGGQGLTRFILDNKSLFKEAFVFDFGTGCGAGAMASSLSGARNIIANDIDKYALVSTKLNFRLNGIKDNRITYSCLNFLDAKTEYFVFDNPCGHYTNRFILLGDMFYDAEFAELLFSWLKRMQTRHGFRVLVGDPDRHPLAGEDYISRYKIKFEKLLLGRYALPGYVIKEHYGFNTTNVFELKF